ncbi:hypothetical protein EDD27_0086 [Nonomuraea polychroma]|uniref:Uncharacterized protein n=1 Tax=Nonomuraea polychroma TaxID=46176 RepID=A0A438LWC4_9ACTN|nr:hypothetical protein [Nonomuraea polychroma]RVX37810.1 hypothetical protein EDD27_0086 [Nonomuraea polychroma]
MDERRRWDIDERFTGVSDAAAMLPAVRQLEEMMGGDGWVAEDPESHLLPHLRRVPGWEILGERLLDDGFYEVRARPEEELEGIGVMRAVIRLLSVVAEPSFLVRQAGGDVYDCVTGVMPGDGMFASHGHLIRVIVTK